MLFLILFPVFSILNNNTDGNTSSPDERSSPVMSADEWEFIQRFDEDFEAELEISGCPGAAVAIVRNDQILLLKGYGQRKTGRLDTVNAETVFRIGSLSKGFAGLLTAQLVEEGLLNWDDPVQDYLPEFDLKDHTQAGRITIRHLMSHATGIQRHAYTDLTERGLSFDRIVSHFRNLPVYGKEGEYYAYQNTAFSFIEEIIKRKTGREYTELLQTEIFTPARMDLASTTYQDIRKCDNVAYPHVQNRWNHSVSVRLNKKYYNAVSAGGINASIHDMANWLRVLLGNRPDIISRESLDFIFSPQVKNPDKRSFYGWGGVTDNHYGIGWRIVNWPDHSLIYHGGSVNGYRSEIAVDRKNNIGICVLFSSNNRQANEIIPDFFRDYYEYLEEIKNRDKLIVQGEPVKGPFSPGT